MPQQPTAEGQNSIFLINKVFLYFSLHGTIKKRMISRSGYAAVVYWVAEP